MTKLTNKTIWITGASSGIGEQLTYQLAKKGNSLIISARRKEALEKVKSNCIADSHNNIHVLPLDLSKIDSLDEAAKKAFEIHERIDVLVNNGGISQRSLAIETNFDVDQRVMNVNYFSAVKLTKLVLPGMIKNKSGHILITSSLVGKFGTPFRSAYSASKHALHGFFEALAAEVWENNIYVTIFCGGYIKTNISINAITGDGSANNSMDENQAKGKSAIDAAIAMIRAVEQNKREVYFGGKEVVGVYLKRFIPSLFAKVVRKMKINAEK
ncbi:MAG: SDR family oxidoreductase [Cyclobacteriaceae bacterium]|nr:SDR family oxidoreductase [Cyclobacteriaceae bacterium]